MQYLKTVTLIFIVWLPLNLYSQSLAKDAKTLIKSINDIRNYNPNLSKKASNYPNAADTLAKESYNALIILNSAERADSVFRESSATLLALLYNYEVPMGKDSVFNFNWEKFLQEFDDNPLLSEVLSFDTINFYKEIRSIGFDTLVWKKLTEIQTAPRQKMLDLLHSKASINPSDYLSISKTMHEYTIPPVQHTSALKLSAQVSNKNVNNSIVDAQAVIEGLFNFIIKRAQEEVVINFLDKLVNQDAPGLKALFPTVVEQFSNVDFTYSNSYLERLRQAFYEDFQLMSVRLPEIMLNDDYFQEMQEEPVVYNLLIVYSMIGMAQQGLPIEDILPITHRYIYGRYADSDKKINLTLAENSFDSLEYKKLVTQSQTLISSMLSIYDDLDNAQYHLDTLVQGLEGAYYEAELDPIVEGYLMKPTYDIGKLLGKDGNFDYDLTLLPSMLEGKLDADHVLRYNTIESYDNFFSIERNPDLWRAAGLAITRNLNGNWYSDYTLLEILRHWHEDLLGFHEAVENWRVAIDTTSKLQAEMDLLEKKAKRLQDLLVSTNNYWKSQSTYDQQLQFLLLANIVSDFSGIDVQKTVFVPADTISGSTSSEPIDTSLLETDSLEDLLEMDSTETPDTLEVETPDPSATETADPSGAELPEALTAPPTENAPEIKAASFQIDSVENIRQKRELLRKVEERLFILNDTLSNRNPNRSRRSPVVNYIVKKHPTMPYPGVLNKIENLAIQFDDLKLQIDTLDMKYGGTEAKVKDNSKPILQLSELLTYLMYGLRTDNLKEDERWISRESLDSILNNPQLENAYLGLLYQRMSNIKDLGTFSPTGLAQLLQGTIADISSLPSKEAIPSDSTDILAFYKKISFGTNLLNRLLELPLTVDPDEKTGAENYFKPLAEQKRAKERGLDKLPGITNQLTDFVYFLNVRDHRHAVSSGIRLFLSLTDAAGSHAKPKCDTTVSFLREYGPFIADLIDAKSSKQVEDLLNSIADPPGSSRIKRRKKLTVGLNAYLGASIGREDWDGTSAVGGNFLDVSPTIPVGIAISWLGKNKYKLNASGRPKLPGSTSIFLSFLDLGEMLTLRSVSEEDYENIFSFKNVFKPSLQIHKNLQRSPFYLGLGAQLGTQYFNLNGVEQSINANKIFVSFGIDVPIKTLYQK